jgi:hypothetical protein
MPDLRAGEAIPLSRVRDPREDALEPLEVDDLILRGVERLALASRSVCADVIPSEDLQSMSTGGGEQRSRSELLDRS